VLKRERNHSRLEIRFLQCLEVTPSQVQFPGAGLVAQLETRVKRKDTQTRQKKWSREIVYLVSSLTLSELQAQGLLRLKRGYWVVESRLHHCLDITLREDTSRVRTPKAARILGTIRRVVVSLANAAVNRARQKNPKTKYNTGTFQNRFKSSRGGHQRLHALLTAKFPNLFDL
jgi:predicted transposase YbfD/YdcC